MLTFIIASIVNRKTVLCVCVHKVQREMLSFYDRRNLVLVHLTMMFYWKHKAETRNTFVKNISNPNEKNITISIITIFNCFSHFDWEWGQKWGGAITNKSACGAVISESYHMLCWLPFGWVCLDLMPICDSPSLNHINQQYFTAHAAQMLFHILCGFLSEIETVFRECFSNETDSIQILTNVANNGNQKKNDKIVRIK